MRLRRYHIAFLAAAFPCAVTLCGCATRAPEFRYDVPQYSGASQPTAIPSGKRIPAYVHIRILADGDEVYPHPEKKFTWASQERSLFFSAKKTLRLRKQWIDPFIQMPISALETAGLFSSVANVSKERAALPGKAPFVRITLQIDNHRNFHYLRSGVLKNPCLLGLFATIPKHRRDFEQQVEVDLEHSSGQSIRYRASSTGSVSYGDAGLQHELDQQLVDHVTSANLDYLVRELHDDSDALLGQTPR